jgi:hypothetical protein
MPSSVDQRTVRRPVYPNVALKWPSAEDDPRSTSTPEPPPIVEQKLLLAKAEIRHLSAILKELVELHHGPESDEYGILRPTEHAFNESYLLLVDAAIVSARKGRQIPLGCISTDSEGGVRVEWFRDKVNVHLVVPATDTEVAYVYHELGSDYGTDDATPEILARWLKELAN